LFHRSSTGDPHCDDETALITDGFPLLVIPAALNSGAGQVGIQLFSFDVIPAQAGIHFDLAS
jgi:hypothetical protein